MRAKLNFGGTIYTRIFSIVVFISSFVATLMCLLLRLGENRIIALLPLAFGVFFFLSRKNRKYLNNISLSIINISAYFRYIIYPIIIAIALNGGNSYEYDTKCVYYLIYELFGVFLVIELFGHKLNVEEVKEVPPSRLAAPLGVPNLSILVLLVPILVMFPSLITRLSVSMGVEKAASTSGVVEILFTMGIWVLFVFLLILLSKFKERSRYLNVLGFILAAAVAVYYVLFNTISDQNVRRWQIISCGLAILYVLLRLFPTKKRVILVWGAVGLLVAVILGSFIKFGVGISFMNFVNEYLNLEHFTEYFGGMKNITKALDIFDDVPATQGLRSTLTDLFSGAPVISSLFDFDTYSTPAIFQDAVGRTDIICPLTAQSIAHFGVIGTPVLAMIMTYLAIIFNRAAKKTDNLFAAYVLIELVVFFSLFIELNTAIVLGKLWIRLMFLAIQPIEDRTKIKFVWQRGNIVRKTKD